MQWELPQRRVKMFLEHIILVAVAVAVTQTIVLEPMGLVDMAEVHEEQIITQVHHQQEQQAQVVAVAVHETLLQLLEL
jgi:hypothetical protein